MFNLVILNDVDKLFVKKLKDISQIRTGVLHRVVSR
jgi:hypothetical protein